MMTEANKISHCEICEASIASADAVSVRARIDGKWRQAWACPTCAQKVFAEILKEFAEDNSSVNDIVNEEDETESEGDIEEE